MLDRFSNPLSSSSDTDDAKQDHIPSDDLIHKKITQIETILDQLIDDFDDTRLRREHRDTIIQRQTDILQCFVTLTANRRDIKHFPAEEDPTLNELASAFEAAKDHLNPQYIDHSTVVEVADRIQQLASDIKQELAEHPEMDWAYDEKFQQRPPNINHKIQSFGVPDGIDEEELEQGQDGTEVYACGRALKAMDDIAEDPDSPLWLGVGTRNGRDVSIDKDVLFRHRAIFGQTGYGKSTLLINDAEQLIRSGAGLCLIDPKGDDSRRLMQLIPDDRMDDVVWIEPSATGEYLSGFNYITMGIDEDDPNYDTARANLVDDLKKMLKMSADYWGARMDRVAGNIITAMNRYNDRTPDSVPEMNLVDLYYILKSEASRREFAARCKKAKIRFVEDYLEEIADMSDDDLEPLLGRFQPWIEDPIARRMIGFREGGVNIPKAIGNNRIIIVRMGQEPRDLKRMLGMAVIRRIWSRIRSRADTAEHARKPFYLFVDEFDNIALRDETIPSIISESRSYRLSLNVANQYPDQLPQNVIKAITTNCDTIISFNPGDEQAARTYNTQLGLDPSTLTEEVNYHVWLRTTIDENMERSDAFRAYVYPPHPPRRSTDAALDCINQSLKTFGRKRRSDEQTYRELLFNGGSGKWETGIGKMIEHAEDKDENGR